MFLGAEVKKAVVREAKRKGVIAYLRTLQGTRRFVILCLAAFLVLQIMIFSGFGALVTGFLLWDYDFAAKIEILFGVFIGFFALPFIALLIIFSERFWYKASGAERLVESLRND
jgi:hypothetical protein